MYDIKTATLHCLMNISKDITYTTVFTVCNEVAPDKGFQYCESSKGSVFHLVGKNDINKHNCFFHSCTMHSDVIQSFISPTNE
jgi:hypothetical protein